MTDEEAILIMKEKVSSAEKTKSDSYTKEKADKLFTRLNGSGSSQQIPKETITDEERMPVWDKWEPTEEETHELMRTRMAEAKEETNSIILYDTITKTKIPYSDFKKNYNEKYAKIYLKYKELNERVPEEVSKEFWKEFGKPTKQIKPAIVEKEIAPVNDKIFEPDDKKEKGVQFILTPFPVIDNKELWKKISKYMGVYIYICRNIVRGKMIKDPLNIYENYYKKGKLAFSNSYREIGKANNSVNTAESHAKALKEIGAIKIELVKMKIKDKNGQETTTTKNVFILGTHNEKKKPYYKETYLINNI